MCEWAGAGGNLALAQAAIPVDGGPVRRRALTAQRKQVSALGVVEHEHTLGRQRIRRNWLSDRRRETCGHDRVEGIAAGQQHSHTCHRGQIVTAGNHSLGPIDNWTTGRLLSNVALFHRRSGNRGCHLPLPFSVCVGIELEFRLISAVCQRVQRAESAVGRCLFPEVVEVVCRAPTQNAFCFLVGELPMRQVRKYEERLALRRQ